MFARLLNYFKQTVMQIILLIVLVLALDLYAFQAIKVITANLAPSIITGISIGYWAFTVLSIITLIAAFISTTNEWNKSLFTIVRAVIFIVYFAKVIIAVFLLIDDVRRLFTYRSSFSPLFQYSYSAPNPPRKDFMISKSNIREYDNRLRKKNS